jgi:fatty-acyl-CoA synthase
VYPVPDESEGDQVMAAVVLRDGATLTPEAFEEFLRSQADLSAKAWPRYVWIAEDLPMTATNKILKRELVAHGTTPPGGLLWKRDGTSFQWWPANAERGRYVRKSARNRP